MPNLRSMMNRTGMVTTVLSRIRTDSFNSHYTLLGKELGRGKFAVVKKCRENCSGREYAAKFLRKRRKGQDCRTDIIHEIAILEMAKGSPHVVDLHEVFETPSELILVLEYAAGGEIFNQCVAEGEEAFTERDVIRLINQVLTGVEFLHRNNVVHLDLKPQNILLTSSNPLGDIRIVDFGLSRKVGSVEVREILGTPEYVAPEILNYEPISTATDMWGIGVLTYVMLTGISPFLGDDQQTTYLNISRVDVDYTQDVFEGISDLALDFIQTLLVKDPRKRTKAVQCLEHPWLSSDSRVPRPASGWGEEEEEEEDEDEEEEGGERGSGQPGGGGSEELVLVASYTLCRKLDESLDQKPVSRHKHFPFDEPFAKMPDIQQKLVC